MSWTQLDQVIHTTQNMGIKAMSVFVKVWKVVLNNNKHTNYLHIEMFITLTCLIMNKFQIKLKKTPLTQGHQSDWGKAYLPVPSLYYQHGSKSWNVWCQCKSSNEGDKWKVKQMQPVWLCIFSYTPFEETFKNTRWRKVKLRATWKVLNPLNTTTSHILKDM